MIPLNLLVHAGGLCSIRVEYRVHGGHVEVGKANLPLLNSGGEGCEIRLLAGPPIGEVEGNAIPPQMVKDRWRATIDTPISIEVPLLGVVEEGQPIKGHVVNLEVSRISI